VFWPFPPFGQRVSAFLKKGKKDYGPAIKIAKERRRHAERGTLAIQDVIAH
jgi:hypothetical protein